MSEKLMKVFIGGVEIGCNVKMPKIYEPDTNHRDKDKCKGSLTIGFIENNSARGLFKELEKKLAEEDKEVLDTYTGLEIKEHLGIDLDNDRGQFTITPDYPPHMKLDK